MYGSILIWRLTFVFFFLLRYLRTIVHALVFFFLIKPSMPIENPSHSSSDVTVLLPSVLDADIIPTLRSIINNHPYQVILVVLESDLAQARSIKKAIGFCRFVIVTVTQLDKRLQLVEGLRKVQTSIVVCSDDDVIWHPKLLSHLLTPFEDASVGATGPNQRAVRRPNPSGWSFLAACYLERRNFNTMTTNYLDGGVSTLSGRTFACRTEIVQSDAFYDFFIKDEFLGRKIKIGDDKRFTMRFFSQGWKIRLVYTEEAVLYTSVVEDARFLRQCLRWARSHWQGNLSVVARQSYWWRRHCWSAYATYLGTLMTPAVVIDLGLCWILQQAMRGESRSVRCTALWVYVSWTLLQKTVKIWPHFARWPSDMKYLPIMIIFSYAHGIINLWAVLTMTANEWGGHDISRK